MTILRTLNDVLAPVTQSRERTNVFDTTMQECEWV
jgi:hypothetical protein